MKASGKLPDAVGNFFPLPNVIFHLGLSAEEIATYAFLLYCEDRKTYQCFPSYTTIGDAIGKTKNSVKKYVDGLRDKGLIETEPTKKTAKDGAVLNGNLLYTILPVDDAVRAYNEAQIYHAQIEFERQKIRRLKQRFNLNLSIGFKQKNTRC